MMKRVLYLKRASRTALFVLLMLAGMAKMMAQTPYRQYADDGVLLNFHEIDNVDFRVFLLYNLSQNDQFVLIEDETPGLLASFLTTRKTPRAFMILLKHSTKMYMLISACCRRQTFRNFFQV